MPSNTGPTVTTDPRDRMDTILEALATSNRAAIAHRQELQTLRLTLLLAILIGGVYLYRSH